MAPQAMTAEITQVVATLMRPTMINEIHELDALFNGLKANATSMLFKHR
jgi:hypothetical protein